MAGPVRPVNRSCEAGGGGSMTAHALAHHAPEAGGPFVAHGPAVA